MVVRRLALGIAFLALGLAYTIDRGHLVAWLPDRRGRRNSASPMMYTVVGGLYLLLGAVTITSSFF